MQKNWIFRTKFYLTTLNGSVAHCVSPYSYLRLLHKFEVSQGCQLQCAGLERVPRLVDDQDVKHDVVLVHVDVGLRVHGVREARQLSDLGKML